MKALLVIDDKQVLEQTKDIIESFGFDTICYQWIIKALDNVEEIAPHIIVISAKDYPRQWKTFVQYVRGLNFRKEPTIILHANNLSADEHKKIDYFGIKTLINDIDFDKQKLIDALSEFKPIEEIADSTEIAEVAVTEEIADPIVFTVKHPTTGETITGKVEDYTYPILHFIPDNPEMNALFRFGQSFNECTLQETDEDGNVNTSVHRAQVRGIGTSSIKFCLLK